MDPRHGRPVWDGTGGRLEVWYATATALNGDGVWLHAETVAPLDGGPARAHGWVACFPVHGPPRVARFGPTEVTSVPTGEQWWSGGGVTVTAAGDGCRLASDGELVGAPAWDGDDPAASAEPFAFDVTLAEADAPMARPLWTFTRTAWDRQLLPGCQFVPLPTGTTSGVVRIGDVTVDLDGGTGNLARIYGHGNAERWGWLHAELGDGDVLEIVAAVSRRAGLRQLPPLAAVQLRVNGVDWPRNPLRSITRFRTRFDGDRWEVRGVSGRRRVTVEVSQPAERCVTLRYRDPDGDEALCTNTERADVTVRLERYDGGWKPDREWHLDGTAHAEVGTRR